MSSDQRSEDSRQTQRKDGEERQSTSGMYVPWLLLDLQEDMRDGEIGSKFQVVEDQ